MAVDLDTTDLAILKLLLRDGRAPASQIAEQVGLSRPAVADRIEKLERQGAIRGTTVVIDPQAVGQRITAFVAARGPKMGAKAWVAFRKLMEQDEILEVHSVAGEDCFLIKMRTDSIASLNTLVHQLSDAPMSLATRTTIVLETYCEKVGGIALVERSQEVA